MLIDLDASKRKFNWPMASFILLTVSMAVYTELFQESFTSFFDKGQVEGTAETIKFSEIDKLLLKNRSGTYQFVVEAISDEGNVTHNHWKMVSPKNLRANQKALTRLLKEINSIKVRKIFPLDKINQSNFFIDRPLLTLNYQLKNGDTKEFNLGLINAIDNSAYLSVFPENLIYQIDRFIFPYENYNLDELVDTRAFPVDLQDIHEIKIYRGKYSSNYKQFEIKKKDNSWIDRNGRSLDDAKLGEHLKEIFNAKADIILDQNTPELSNQISKALDRPLFEIEIKANQTVVRFTLSNLVDTLHELKIPSRAYLILKSDILLNPVLISKNIISILNESESKFKELNVKKIFY